MTREEAIFCEKSYIGETNCTDCKYYGTEACQSRESHKMAIKALEQTIWIPYKDRKPDKEGKYLCCFDGGYITAVIYDSGEFLIKDYTPIAWMELPDPYRAESEGEW